MLTVILMTLITSIMAMLIDVDILSDLLSIGTLQAYSMVSACILYLRYDSSVSALFKNEPHHVSTISVGTRGLLSKWRMFSQKNRKIIVICCIISLVISAFFLGCWWSYGGNWPTLSYCMMGLGFFGIVASTVIIALLPQNQLQLDWKVFFMFFFRITDDTVYAN